MAPRLRWSALWLAIAALAGCGGSQSGVPSAANSVTRGTGVSESQTSTRAAPKAHTTTEAAPSNSARNKALEAHLRKYLPLGMGSAYDQVASVVVTDRVTITTKTSDPNYLYRGACQTALDLAQENSGVTDVEVIDSAGNVKSSSVGTGTCDKRY